jgi:hypothetical protein
MHAFSFWRYALLSIVDTTMLSIRDPVVDPIQQKKRLHRHAQAKENAKSSVRVSL